MIIYFTLKNSKGSNSWLPAFFFAIFILLHTANSCFAQSSYYYNWNEFEGLAYGGIVADNNGTLYSAGIGKHLGNYGQYITQSDQNGILQQAIILSYPTPIYNQYASIGCFNDNSLCWIVPIDTNAISRKIHIGRFDNNLQLIWAKATPIDYDYITCKQTFFAPNNEIWFATSSIIASENKGIALFAIDEMGNLTQQHRYKFPTLDPNYTHIDAIFDLKTTLDSNFLVLTTGRYNSVGNNVLPILFKVNPQGEVLWSKEFSNGMDINNFYLHNIICNPDGSYLLSGNSGILSNGESSHFLLLKIDGMGNVLWNKAYPKEINYSTWLYMGRSAANDGYIGLSSNHIANDIGWSITCFDEQGDICWKKSYSGYGSWVHNFLAQADGYVFPKSNVEYIENGNSLQTISKIGIIKVDINGDIAIDCLQPTSSILLPTSLNIISSDLEITHTMGNITLSDVTNQFTVTPINIIPEPYQCPPPIALFQISDSLLCPNTCLSVADSSLYNPNEWLWLMPGASPNTYSGINPPPLCYNETGTYSISLVVSNDYGSDTTSIDIVVAETACIDPIADFALNESQICPNQCITATNLSLDDQLSYTWYANGALPNTYVGINPPPFCYNEMGTYSISLVAANAWDSVVVTKNIVVNPTTVTEHYVEQCTGKSYWWNNEHLTQSGDYINTVSNQYGCDSTLILHLNFVECPDEYLLFPTSFSPNNDGTNDFFSPITSHTLNNYNLQIYNRWGERVFDTHDTAQAWDGRYEALDCPIGVYIWIASYDIVQNGINQSFSKKGNITLIR